MATIHIPADIHVDAEVTLDLDTRELVPLYVTGCDEHNPDEFSVALYSDYSSESTEDNIRANMIAEVVDSSDLGITGDVFLVCDEELAQKFIRSDQMYHTQCRLDKAFKAWLTDYAKANGMDPAVVFLGVAAYVQHVESAAADQAGREAVAAISETLGLDPKQVAVLFL